MIIIIIIILNNYNDDVDKSMVKGKSPDNSEVLIVEAYFIKF